MAGNTALLGMLDAEWARVCADFAKGCLPPLWRSALPAHSLGDGDPADGLTRLCELVAGRDDAVTADLVRLAQAGDQAAGQVLVRALVPKLMAISRRDPRHDLDDYVGAAWLRIMDYPVDQRPRAILVNLSLDSLKMLSRQTARHRSEACVTWLSQPDAQPPFPEIPEPPWGGGPDTRQHAADYIEAVLNVAERTSLMPQTTIAVLRSVYRDGLNQREAAARHDISYDMARYHCSRGIRALRLHRQELLEELGGW